MPRDLDHYESNAARALVLMHEEELRRFLGVWKTAASQGVKLHQTDDPDYASMGALLRHVLACARFYVLWMTERLELPQPEIDEPPAADRIAEGCDRYTEHVLEAWRSALATVADKDIDREAWLAPWKTPFTIDSMLEHATVHPQRHGFQLRELMESHGAASDGR